MFFINKVPGKIHCLIILLLAGTNSVFGNRIDSLLALLEKTRSDTSRISILLSLQKEPGIPMDSSYLLLQKAVSLSKKSNTDKYIFDSHNALAKWHSTEQNYDSAVFILKKITTERSTTKYILGLGTSYRLIGNNYIHESLDSALYFYLKSLALLQSIQNVSEIALTENNIGVVYSRMGKTQQALEISERQVQYFRSIGDKYSENYAELNCGFYSETLGDFAKSEKHFRHSVQLCQELNDSVGEGLAYFNLGGCYALTRRFQDARNAYHHTIEIGKRLNVRELLYKGYGGLANLDMTLGKWDDGILNAKKANDFKLPTNESKSEMALLMYSLYIGKKNYKKALEFYQEYIATNDSMQNTERLKKADELEATYRNKEKQSQIELLNKEKKLEQAEAERQKNQKNMLGLILVLAVTSAAFIFSRYISRVKQKQDAERARISRDLHDDVGATLGSISIYSEVAKSKSTGNAELEEVLVKIGDGSREMLELMNEIVWSVNPKNDTPEQLIYRMQNFAAATLTPKLISYEFHIESLKSPELILDMEKKKNFFLIFKEGVHNIVKYSEAKNVSIKLSSQGKYLTLELKDDGKGFDVSLTKSVNGNGLKNIKSRSKEINAKLEIESELNKGTSIRLSIPV